MPGYESLEGEGRCIRAMLAPGLRPDHPIGGLGVFERLRGHSITRQRRTVRLDYDVELMAEGTDGKTSYEADRNVFVVKLSERAYDGLFQEPEEGRARFSLYHEIAHAWLHFWLLLELAQIPHMDAALYRNSRPPHQRFEDTEWQSDGCSASVLMPAAGLAILESRYGKLTTELIRDNFIVSGEAAAIRLGNYMSRRSDLLRAWR